MHADQDDRHPWLREENFLLQNLFDRRVPVFGVCLGAQLLAKAAHANVRPLPDAEIGWYDVELTDAADRDPVFARLPRRFPAFQWHYYTYDVPAGAVELARSERSTQAFRLGDAVWGVQFHPEVTEPQIRRWLDDKEVDMATSERIARETSRQIEGWNAIGRELCTAWLEVAERVAAAPV
jgi:GMP synthase (glutamine-hydrolysing)